LAVNVLFRESGSRIHMVFATTLLNKLRAKGVAEFLRLSTVRL